MTWPKTYHCFICGVECYGFEDLVAHTEIVHLPQHITISGGHQRICWCGEKMYRRPLIMHFIKNGGIERHYVECKLTGVKA